MNKPKIAVLIDLASLRISCEGFKKLAERLEQQFEISNVKFYSYVAKRNRDFNEYIAAKGYDAVTPIASRRRNKLDTRQIIDATLIGVTSSVDAVGFAVGEGDILPIVSYLKLKGKDVYDINVKEGDYTSEFSGFIQVEESWLREGYAAPTRMKQAKKEPKKVIEKPVKAENKYAEEVKRILLGKDILARYKR